jgi:hypothetical protein
MEEIVNEKLRIVSRLILGVTITKMSICQESIFIYHMQFKIKIYKICKAFKYSSGL